MFHSVAGYPMFHRSSEVSADGDRTYFEEEKRGGSTIPPPIIKLVTVEKTPRCIGQCLPTIL